MKFIIASNNKKKLVELERILNPLGINAVTPKEEGITLDDVEENGTTFAENAFLKANAAYLKTGLPAVADDSGLCVDALDGRPGVYTARYGGEGLTDEERYIKLLDEMKNVDDDKRSAHFTSSICCILPDGSKPRVFVKVKLVMSQSAKTDLAMIRFLCLATRVLQSFQPKKRMP